MSLKKIAEAATRVIRDLPTRPTGPTGRFTAAELKAFFDTAATRVAEAVNEALTELESMNGARDIGFSATPGVDADNVQDAIENVQEQVRSAYEESAIPNGSVTEPKLAANSVSGEKLQSGAVTEPKIGVRAVTAEKVSPGAAGWVKVDENDFYLDPTASGSVYGSSMNITKQSFWYSPATKLVFWNAYATVNAAEAGEIFMSRLHGVSRYYPRLDEGLSSIEYGGYGGDKLGRVEICRDTVGNGSHLYFTAKIAGNGQDTIMSGFYICVGE